MPRDDDQEVTLATWLVCWGLVLFLIWMEYCFASAALTRWG